MKRMLGLAAVLAVLAVPMAARADDIIYVPARVSYYAAPAPVVSAPVVTYASPAPVVSYYQPSVSYYAAPAVSYYAAPAVSYYAAPAYGTPVYPAYRYGFFGRRLVPTYTYGAPVAAAPVYVQRSYY